ncbi:hypothetical protein MTO96_019609 [Rhipicephalus appendiculatus]
MSSEQHRDKPALLVPLDDKSQSEPRLEPPPTSLGSTSALSSQTEHKSREPPEQPLVEYGDIRRPSISVNEGELGSQPPFGEHRRKSIGSVDYGDPGPDKSEKEEALHPMPPVAGDNEEAPKAAAVPMSTALVPLDEHGEEQEEQQHPAIKDSPKPPPPKPLPLELIDEKPPPPPPQPPPPAQPSEGKKDSRSSTAGTTTGSSSEGSESETSTSASSSTGTSSSGTTSTTGSTGSSSTSGSTSTSGTTGSTTGTTTTRMSNLKHEPQEKAEKQTAAPVAAVEAKLAAPVQPPQKPHGEATASSSSESSSGSGSGSDSDSSESGTSTGTATTKDQEKQPLLPKQQVPTTDASKPAKPEGDAKSSFTSPSSATSGATSGATTGATSGPTSGATSGGTTSGPTSGATSAPTSGTKAGAFEPPFRHPPVPPGGLRPHRPPPKPAEQTPKVPLEPEKPHKGSEKQGNDPAVYAIMNNEAHLEVESKRHLIPRCLFVINILVCLILVLISHIFIVDDLERRASMTSPPVAPEIMEDDHVCRDVQCSAAGTHLFYVLNASVKPCDSIYNYVCKSWIHEGPQNYRKIVLGSERIFVDNMYTEMKTALLSYQARSSESEAVRKATELYRLCLEEPKKRPKNTNLINQLLSDYGLSSWPYSESAATNFFSSPYLSLARFIRDSGVGAVVAVKMLPDPENTQARVFAIDCSTFVVPMGTLLQFAEHKSDTLLGYKAYIADVLKAVRPRRQDIDKLATTIMAFEVNMAHRCNEGCRKKRFKRTTLEDLKGELKSKGVDWQQFLETVAPVKSDIRPSSPVLVRSARYLKSVSMLFEDQQTLRRMMNYVGWRAVHHFMRHAGTSFRDLTEAFVTARLKEERFPYDRSCIRDVNDVMPFAVGRVFAETVLSQDHFDFAARSVNALMKGFQVVLKEFQWAPLDVQSKFSRMDYIVSYPEWIKNYSRLNAYYDSVPISGSYFSRYISWPSLSSHPGSSTWSGASGLRARPPFYDVRDNTLIVPAGAMQPPYYDTRRPWGLTFGGLGTMVSRDFVNEMFHTPEGILKDDKQKTIFKDKTQCLLDYIKKGLDPNTNPDCTSIVTDVFALRVAYEAYQIFVDGRDDDTLQGVAQMTPDQLFFVSAVRTLCTSIREQHFSQVVLLGKNVTEMDLIDPAVMSMREFEDAFDCKQSNIASGENLFNKCFYPPQAS